MASTEPMSLDDIQGEIHNLYQNGIDVPAPGDDDYTLRTAMINHYIRVWEGLDGVNWRVLRLVDQSQTLDSLTKVVTLSASFKKLVGKVFVTRPSDGYKREFPVYSMERLDDTDDLDQNGYAWVQGSPAIGYTLNFASMMQEFLGGTIQFRYVRYANRLQNPDDVADMTEPQYLVSMVVSRLFKLAGRTTDYQVNFDDGQDALSAMITANTEMEEKEETESMGHQIGGFGVMGL